MEVDEEVEGLESFSLADEIFAIAGRLRFMLILFALLAAILLVATLWFVILQLPLQNIFSLYVALGIVYVPISLLYGLPLVRSLSHWMDDYFDFAFVVKFELFPATGDTPIERIQNKLGEIYPEVSRLQKRRPKAIQHNAGLKRRPSIVWDLIIDLNPPLIVRIPWIHRHLGTPKYLLVKRFETREPVDSGQLREIADGLRRDLRWNSAEILALLLVSTGGFTQEVISQIQDETNPVLSEYDIDLVLETPDGYTLLVKE